MTAIPTLLSGCVSHFRSACAMLFIAFVAIGFDPMAGAFGGTGGTGAASWAATIPAQSTPASASDANARVLLISTSLLVEPEATSRRRRASTRSPTLSDPRDFRHAFEASRGILLALTGPRLNARRGVARWAKEDEMDLLVTLVIGGVIG